jgi:diaminohydroxyphosphoribosylaminopyrimidine deaminase / 5-amino-6-(5-phosphoribosylamino)uracil reductase
MRRALALARRGITSPNPMVGAVIVRDGRIVGEGYHKAAGMPHAEVGAIESAGEAARGATMYVTLEPCCHWGRTPPCAKAVIASGISSVHAAMVDPDPRVAGKGIAELEAAGIETHVGLLEDQARKLNEVFIKYAATGLPFVTLKYAMTLDGKIATQSGDSKWISCDASRRIVHKLRERNDAILVGIGTLLSDDPSLSARVGSRVTYPIRIVVDAKAETPPSAKLLSLPGETVIAVTNSATEEKMRKLKLPGVRIVTIEETNGRVRLPSLMRTLGEMKITSVFIEGGGRIAASALSSGIVDKVIGFVAPKIVGGESAKSPVEGDGVQTMSDALHFEISGVRNIGCDIMIEAYPCSRV